MNHAEQDIWSRWLLHRRDGDDPATRELAIAHLRPIRDRVLDNADLADQDVLLDVGCGDGLIAFGALETARLLRVIFCDVSQDLLKHCEVAAEKLALIERCQFVEASAEDLSKLPDASVSVVTTRSVLIYVQDKVKAFREFYRVLKHGGRMSLFEPINSFAFPEPDHLFSGFDVTPVIELARKVKDVYRQARPTKNDPMLDFDERDLFQYALHAGFEELHMSLEASVAPRQDEMSWDAFFQRAPNPQAPTFKEAVEKALDQSQASEFVTHLRPLVENKAGTRKMAAAYIWGVKPS